MITPDRLFRFIRDKQRSSSAANGGGAGGGGTASEMEYNKMNIILDSIAEQLSQQQQQQQQQGSGSSSFSSTAFNSGGGGDGMMITTSSSSSSSSSSLSLLSYFLPMIQLLQANITALHSSSTISSSKNQDQLYTMIALLKLIHIVSKKLPKMVFRKHGMQLARIYSAALVRFDVSFHNVQIMKPLILCVRELLRAQNRETWFQKDEIALAVSDAASLGVNAAGNDDNDAEMEGSSSSNNKKQQSKKQQKYKKQGSGTSSVAAVPAASTPPIAALFEQLITFAIGTENNQSLCNYPAKRSVIELLSKQSSLHAANAQSSFFLAACKHITEISLATIAACTNKNCVSMLHLMDILYETLRFMPHDLLMSIAKKLVRLPTLSNAQLSQNAYRALGTLVALDENEADSDDDEADSDDEGGDDDMYTVGTRSVASTSMRVGAGKPKSTELTAADVQFILKELLAQKPNPHSPPVSIIAFFKILVQYCAELHRLDRNTVHDKFMVQVFNMLLDEYMHGVSEDVSMGAGEAMQSLLEELIDADLIKEAVQQYKPTPFGEIAMQQEQVEPSSSVLLRVIMMLERALSAQFESTLDIVLATQATLFEQLGAHALPLLQNMLLNLDKLRRINSLRYQSSMDKTIGAAVSALGPMRILQVLPMDLLSVPIDPSSFSRRFGALNDLTRHWLLPILCDHVENTSLEYFLHHFVPLSNRIIRKSRDCLEQKSESTNAKYFRNIYLQIWSLLPGFCTFSTDFATSFPKIAKLLGDILMGNDPNVKLLIESLPVNNDSVAAVELATHISTMRQIVCQALQRAIAEHRSLATTDSLPSDASSPAFVDHNRTHNAQQTVQTVLKYADNFLPILFNIYRGATEQERHAISQTIVEFSSVMETAKVNEYFKQVLKKALQLSTIAANKAAMTDGAPQKEDERETEEKKLAMLDLAISMAPSLPVQSLSLLFKFCKPYLTDSKQHQLQKRSYRAIHSILSHNTNSQQFLETTTDVWPTLLQASTECHASSKKHRLKCLEVIVPLLPLEAIQQNLALLLGELIMARKETNAHTRQNAESVIGALVGKVRKADGRTDDDHSVNNNLILLFKAIMAGFGGTTPAMLSGTAKTLTEAFRLYAVEVEPIVADLLSSMIILLQHKSTEVLVSALEFLNCAVSVLQAPFLQNFVPRLVPPMLYVLDQDKNSDGRKTVQSILRKLLKMFSVDQLKQYFNASNSKILTSINKQMKQQEKKKKQKNKKGSTDKEESKKSKQQRRGADESDDDMSSASDSADESDESDLDEDDEDEVLDLLAPTSALSVQQAQHRRKATSSERSDGSSVFKKTKDGKLIIDDDSDDENGKSAAARKQQLQGKKSFSGGMLGKKRSRGDDDDGDVDMSTGGDIERAVDDYEDDDDVDSDAGEQKQQTNNGKRRRGDGALEPYLARMEQNKLRKKRRSEREFVDVTLGQRFRSKRGATGRGDVQKNGLQPFAYLPMDPKMMNKRNKNKQSTFSKFEQASRQQNNKRKK